MRSAVLGDHFTVPNTPRYVNVSTGLEIKALSMASLPKPHTASPYLETTTKCSSYLCQNQMFTYSISYFIFRERDYSRNYQ